MATIAEIRTTVDSWLAARWATFQTRQSTYFANHGHYWQGLWTSVPPEDGASATPVLTSHPTDQAASWVDAGLSLPTQIPCSISCNVYDAPEGKGYVVVVRVVAKGKIYERAAQVGPRPDLAHSWRQV